MDRLIGVLLAGMLIFSAGCVVGGSDARSVGTQLNQSRQQFVESGLLVPATDAGKQSYRAALIQERAEVQRLGGGDKETLQAYLDGSLALLDMQQRMNESQQLIKNINPDLVDCSPNAPSTMAIAKLRDASEKADTAQRGFALVQKNTPIANVLGADYVVQVNQSVERIKQAQMNVIEQIQTSCI